VTVGEIFRRHGPQYRQNNDLAGVLVKTMLAIEACRTPTLGGHRRWCLDCGHHVDEFNSCRNRHCPGCQALPQARWIEKRQRRVLPVGHFHVVFTLPEQLRPIAHANRATVFSLLMRTAADTLIELGNSDRHLGAQLGVTEVLHTWTRQLAFHPHVHCVVTAGGLACQGSSRWVHSPDFLFPVRVMGALFRGKFLDRLGTLAQAGEIKLPDNDGTTDSHQAFRSIQNDLYNTDWVVYCKRPFAGPQQVFSYLGRYTHRVAISNQRLIAATDDGITFATKGGDTATLAPAEFIRRFLMHVLPPGFTKIRHYGLMASSNVHGRLECARELLQAQLDDAARGPLPDTESLLSWEELLLRLTGIDLTRCPACGSNNTRRRKLSSTECTPLDTS
jgi:hypothetical protein